MLCSNQARLHATKCIATDIEIITVACTTAFLFSLAIPPTRTNLSYYLFSYLEEWRWTMYGVCVRTTWAPLAGDTGTDVAPGSWGCGIAATTEISPRAEKTKACFISGNVNCVYHHLKRNTWGITSTHGSVDSTAARGVSSTVKGYHNRGLGKTSHDHIIVSLLCSVQISFLRVSCLVHKTKQGVGLFRVLIGGSLLFFDCGPQPQNKQ